MVISVVIPGSEDDGVCELPECQEKNRKKWMEPSVHFVADVMEDWQNETINCQVYTSRGISLIPVFKHKMVWPSFLGAATGSPYIVFISTSGM